MISGADRELEEGLAMISRETGITIDRHPRTDPDVTEPIQTIPWPTSSEKVGSSASLSPPSFTLGTAEEDEPILGVTGIPLEVEQKLQVALSVVFMTLAMVLLSWQGLPWWVAATVVFCGTGWILSDWVSGDVPKQPANRYTAITVISMVLLSFAVVLFTE